MNILYIWDADYPWDIRVEKICEALANSGHRVHIAARNLGKRPTYEVLKGIEIHRIRIWSNDRINYFMSFPLFFSPIWRGFLNKIVRSNDIEIIVVRDLPMAIAGIWTGKRFNIPVVFDMAEDYVAMIKDIWDARKFQGLNLIVRNPYLARGVQHYSFKHVDHVFVVIDEAIDVVRKGGGDTKKVTIVSNTPKLDVFKRPSANQGRDIELIKSRYSVIYTGGIQMGRGIQLVLDALPSLLQEIPDLLFVVLGEGYAKEALQKIVAEKSLEDHVLWLGWVEHSEVYEYIKACRIGITPHFVSDHVDTTIPNKIFDYMGCGIPVICSDARPMKRIVDEEGCGRAFRNGNVESLTRAVLDVFSSTTDYGENGCRSVREKYNWQVDEGRLCDVIESFGAHAALKG